MKRFLRYALIGVGVLATLLVLGLAAVYAVTSARMSRTWDVEVREVPVSSDSATVAWGRHLALSRGCTDCHGEDLGGFRFMDAGPVASLWASNLTPGEGGIGRSYDDEDWVRAIRHGIGPDGTPLLFMPSVEYNVLSDEDLGPLISYLKTLPPVDRPREESTVGPVGRLLYLVGDFPLLHAELIDHAPREYTAPVRGPTVEYGRYLSAGCVGCHGTDLAGGPIPGGDPSWPAATNLTPDRETGLGSWSEDDFFRALREGRRPDGSELAPPMPVPTTRRMTDEEIRALWRYLRSLPPRSGP